MIDLSKYEVWFVPGSQSLYGEAVLATVAEHAREIADAFSKSPVIPVKVVCKPVMKTPDSIRELCLEANRAENCVGLILWMHTFSPAQAWIPGLQSLNKPFVHLHTQFNAELPWSTIDMDFMNLNQSAHGDREFGFITSRLGLRRKVVAGFWQDEDVQSELATWTRAACAWRDAQTLRVARFGDNMRQVAVTEGNKVGARINLGYSVEGFGVGDLVDRVSEATDHDVDSLIAEYEASYTLSEALQARGTKRVREYV